MVVNINPYKNISSLKICPALLKRSFAPEKCSPPLGMFSHVTQRALVPSARNPMLLRSNRPKRALYGDSCLKSRMLCVHDLYKNDICRLLQKGVCCLNTSLGKGGVDLGAQPGSYLVRFSTRTKIWWRNKTGGMIHILPPSCPSKCPSRGPDPTG